MLESLARVLQLDDESADYLIGLTAPKPKRARRPRREVVPAGVRQLLEVIGLPAFVEGRYFDVLAANPLAAALSPNLKVGRNRLRDVFLDEGERALYPDWEKATATLVAGFRESVGNDTDDPRFVQLVGELSLASERFRQLWARHDVHTREGAPTRIAHPQVGEMTIGREKLTVGGASDQMLVVYHAKPGTPSGDKLSLLGLLPHVTGTSMVVADQESKGRP